MHVAATQDFEEEVDTDDQFQTEFYARLDAIKLFIDHIAEGGAGTQEMRMYSRAFAPIERIMEQTAAYRRRRTISSQRDTNTTTRYIN